MKKAVLNKAEGRAAHKFQFELTPTTVGALDRVLKGLDGSSLFVQERPSESNASRHTASTARGCGARDLRLQPLWQPAAQCGSLRHLRLWRSPRRRPVAAVMTVAAVVLVRLQREKKKNSSSNERHQRPNVTLHLCLSEPRPCRLHLKRPPKPAKRQPDHLGRLGLGAARRLRRRPPRVRPPGRAAPGAWP